MSALNLNLSQFESRFRSGTSCTAKSILKSDIPAQYQKAYNNSIPSFIEILKQSNQLPHHVEDALDRISHAGFHDPDFARQFREMKGLQLHMAHNNALLQQRLNKLKKRQETSHTIKQQIKQLQDEIETLVKDKLDLEEKIRQITITQEQNTTSVLSLLNLFQSTNINKQTQEEQTKPQKTATQLRHQYVQLDQRIERLQRQLEGRKSHLHQHDVVTQKTEKSVYELQREQAKAKAIMSSQVYEQTQSIVHDALLVLCDYLAEHIQQRNSSLIEQYQNLDAKTDLTKPQEWYPYARLDKRKIVYHGGPTNSGKTYNALQRLMQAKNGLYLGPLRLLAAEVYEKLNSQGVYTSLVTGQERREFPFSTHIAATVEMAGQFVKDREFDVVVIDEIQMIEDDERGFAWTRALLGLRCKEIHVCGGLEARNIVKRIVEACGDEFELHQYERFSDLTVASKSLSLYENQIGAYKKVQPGDCVVAFSRTDIFAIKREIEAQTGYKCCVIYGTLPPDIRTTQAQLFNDPESGYNILVASDAIAMGLNLNIRRIIFNSLYKNDGNDIIRLGHSAVKQIAGRAGRRNSPFPEGEVTCRDPRDLPYLQDCLTTEIDPIKKAGLIPTVSHVEKFAEAFQYYHYGGNTNADGEVVAPSLHTVLKEFSDMAVVKGDYFLCRQQHMVVISTWLKDIPLDISQKYEFCMAPVSTGEANKNSKEILIKFGQKLSANEVPGMTRGSLVKRAQTFADLGRLCSIFSDVELFIWLQNKFPPVNYMEQQAALAKKEEVAALIELGLQEAEKLKLDHCYVERDVKLRSSWAMKQEEKSNGDGLEYDSDVGSDSGEEEEEEDFEHEERREGRRRRRHRGRDDSLFGGVTGIRV